MFALLPMRSAFRESVLPEQKQTSRFVTKTERSNLHRTNVFRKSNPLCTQRSGNTQRCQAAAETLEYGQLSDIGVPLDTYLVLGLAQCFEKNEEGKLVPRMVIEPVSANSLECMVLGAKTCFKAAVGMTVEEALAKDPSRLPEEFRSASYCADFQMRCGASARTWLRPHAMDNLMDLVPLGQTRTKFNFNLDEKRVLNFENEVSDDDNIKQDMSIDVYGRKEEDPAPTAGAPAAKSEAKTEAKKEDDDDLDALLGV